MRNGQTSEQFAAKFSGNRDCRCFESTGVAIFIEDPFQPPIHLLHDTTGRFLRRILIPGNSDFYGRAVIGAVRQAWEPVGRLGWDIVPPISFRRIALRPVISQPRDFGSMWFSFRRKPFCISRLLCIPSAMKRGCIASTSKGAEACCMWLRQ